MTFQAGPFISDCDNGPPSGAKSGYASEQKNAAVNVGAKFLCCRYVASKSPKYQVVSTVGHSKGTVAQLHS